MMEPHSIIPIARVWVDTFLQATRSDFYDLVLIKRGWNSNETQQMCKNKETWDVRSMEFLKPSK